METLHISYELHQTAKHFGVYKMLRILISEFLLSNHSRYVYYRDR
jgi:hypothetical protein